MNHTTKKASAASRQGWKIAQKNAEIFNIHRVCLWIIVTPRTQLSRHLVVAAAVRCQQLCWAKIPPPINRHTLRPRKKRPAPGQRVVEVAVPRKNFVFVLFIIEE